jgi:hypothetical protein
MLSAIPDRAGIQMQGKILTPYWIKTGQKLVRESVRMVREWWGSVSLVVAKREAVESDLLCIMGRHAETGAAFNRKAFSHHWVVPYERECM